MYEQTSNRGTQTRQSLITESGRLRIKRYLGRQGHEAVCVLGNGQTARVDLRSYSIMDLASASLSDGEFLSLVRAHREVRTIYGHAAHRPKGDKVRKSFDAPKRR